MRLISIQYENGNTHKDIVFLSLIESEDKYIGLRSDKLNIHDIERIRRHSKKLAGMENDELIPWFKKHIQSYRKAYRELLSKKVVVTGEYDLNA